MHIDHLRQLSNHIAELPVRSVVFLQAVWRSFVRRKASLRAAQIARAKAEAKAKQQGADLARVQQIRATASRDAISHATCRRETERTSWQEESCETVPAAGSAALPRMA